MARFLPEEHLRRPEDFQLVYDRKQSAADGTLIVYVRPNGLTHHRLGLSVSRKFGSAVVRNRLRRLLREAFRLHKQEIPPGFDLVLIPRLQPEYQLTDLESSLVKLSRQATRKSPRKVEPLPAEWGT